ncbi:hypothetical protein [uncultured Helicobacter sp.]|uniref:hypothetical protein n=1 Tax=uncultured Helicobacter sp. TaxID=175537 RepID=UPI0026061A53|nr:hypothetical protein [uncultured Helicobacter sp.]
MQLNRALVAQYGFNAQEVAMALNNAFSGAQKFLIIVKGVKNMILYCLVPKKIPLWI